MSDILLIGSCEPFSGKSAMVLGIAKKLLQKKKKVRIGKPLATCIELTNLPSMSYEGLRAGNISASDVFIQISFFIDESFFRTISSNKFKNLNLLNAFISIEFS